MTMTSKLLKAMNKFRFVLLTGICMPIGMMAQKKDTTTTVQQPVQTSVDAVVQLYEEKLKNLEKDKETLQAELNQLKIQKAETAKNSEAHTKQVEDSLSLAKKRIDEKSIELNKQKADNDSLKKVLSSLDGIIYKECLFYPLNIRYNQQRINECLNALNAYCRLVDEKHQSDNLKQCIKVYKPFLEGSPSPYLTYTNELIAALGKMATCLKSVENNPQMLDAMKNKCIGDIMRLKYYTLYKDRKNAPYKSIEFLDKALDHLKLLINESRNVDKDIENLKKSLEPKY